MNFQILKEKVTSKKVHFLSTLIKTLDYILATHRSFRLKSAGFPYEIRLQGIPKLEHRYVEQYSVARPLFGDIIPSERVCSNRFRQAFQLQLWVMAGLELYYFEPNILQTPK